MVGFDRPSACGHEGQVVLAAFHGFERSSVFINVLQQVEQEGLSIVPKQAWSRGHLPPLVLFLEVEANGGQSFAACTHPFTGSGVKVQLDGDKALLPFPEGFIVAQAFVADPLMEGMLVNQEQFVARSHQHVGSSELAERDHVWQVVEHPLKCRLIGEVA
jgi:hypothetical protein